MSFPWAINTNHRTYRKRDRARAALARLRRKSLRLLVFLAVSGVTSVLDTPVTRAEPPLTALPQEATQFVTSGTAAISGRTVNALTITQQSQKAILNWQSFNVGRDASVTFRQPDSSSATLNRIFQGSPSEIFGSLKANGQIYLLNKNGIIFGKGAVVDTHSLIASTLNISDEVFNTIGLTNAINQDKATFEAEGAMGLIRVESGAELKSAEGGRIMIFAPQVENHGEITTPGGQAILAASQDKVYLANPDDENLRGLLVEVDTGGEVSNLGKIVAERGNVSLIGYAVNQNGIVRATTSVDLNGSIRLVARDKATIQGVAGKKLPRATRAGTLTLGEGSLTGVASDNIAATAVDAQEQPVSRIELMGHQVRLESGARVVAPAGDVSIAATKTPQAPGPTADPATDNDSRVVMQPGSLIDVSGLASAVLPMERNVIAVELRGSQLADSPLQRNGPLRGETVYVDVRQGTPLANVNADIEGIKRPLDERLSAGGKVTIVSEGGIEMQEGSTIDVSGGAIRYRDGFINTTKLVTQGRVVDIGAADPNVPYDGVLGSQGTARLETGYVEGKDAGTVTLNARELVLQGSLRGQTTTGRYQRFMSETGLAGFMRPYDQLPLRGALTLGAPGYSGLDDFTLRSLADLGAAGINRARIYTNDNLTVPETASLVLSPGGELTLSSAHIDVAGDIAAPGGRVRIEATVAEGGSVRLREGARIDVDGQWVNDGTLLNPGAAPQDPALIDGGSVSVEARGDVILERGSVISADGGAQLQRNGKLQYGNGGDITVASKSVQPDPATLRLDGELHSYSFDKGGRLNITGGGFRIGGAAEDLPAHSVSLSPGFFQSGGFHAYDLTATHTGITVAEAAEVTVRAQNRLLNPDFWMQATGTGIGQLGATGFLPDYQRQPASLALSVNRLAEVNGSPRLELEQGSRIQADPGASVSLTTDHTPLIVNGTIDAAAGDIRLTMRKNPSVPLLSGFDPLQAIRLGPQARLLAQAGFQSVPDASGRGLRTGAVRDGGTVTIAAERGYVLASPGSVIDVSGTTRTLDVQQGIAIAPTVVNGAAGTIDIAAAEGMVLNGGLKGTPGSGAGAAGGTLNLALDTGARGTADEGQRAYPVVPREIVVSASETSSNINMDEPVPDELNGVARLNPEQVAAGGFDRLTLRARSASVASENLADARVRFEGDVRLKLAQALRLDVPVLTSNGGHVELEAGHVALGAKTLLSLTPLEPEAGTGSLAVHGQHVDLIGTLVLRGFGPDGAAEAVPVRIESEGDIRLLGGDQIQNGPDGLFKAEREGIFAAGRLNSAADIELRADQVYTATATDYTLSVTGIDGKITIRSGDGNAAPLSAGSRLTLAADHIEQHGTLRAPFGQIKLDATKSLLLGDGSVTSVSGSGQVVPFGVTEFGQDWLYPLAASYKKPYQAPPEKRIMLEAPDVTLAPGSVIDVTGGGDLLAREHLPGPGGSSDILDNTLSDGTPNTAFAIVPTQTSLYGSYDPFLSDGSPARTGDTVHLAGGGPLAAGEYAILPAGYALLPGAYLVTPLAQTDSPVPGQAATLASGAAIVAGRRGDAGTDTRDSLWSAFLIEGGPQVRNRAEYVESRADGFFADGGRQNRDAGRLAIDASTRLALGGTLASNATGGRGSEVDILADRLAVVAQRSGSPARVELLASELGVLNADSLLLGATRQRRDEAVTLEVRAAEVAVESGAILSAPEVMLAAKQQVTVAGGAKIEASDGDRVSTPAAIELTGDSAFARISSADQVYVRRESAAGQAGTINIAADAVLDGSRSVTLDASRDTVVDGNLRSNDGSISLAAARVSLGETQGVSGGLVLSNDDLARLNARDLRLNSRGTIDFYGDTTLAGDHIALDSAGLAGYRNAGRSASISAETIFLSNRSNADFTAAPDGSGLLNLVARREVTLGEGEFAMRGFSNTTISATGQIIAKPETDAKVQLHVAGDLTLQASRVTASSGADVSIDTRDASNVMVGKMTLTAPATLSPVTDLGAKLELTATEIDHRTHIELPSGNVSLHATGAGGVNIADNASIDVSGRDLVFADIMVGSPGGNVSLVADRGNVAVGAAPLDRPSINVSGAPSGGDAGNILVVAPLGEFELHEKAELLAEAHAGGRAGSFTLDARTLTNGFSPLIAALNDNQADFTDSLQFRLRAGDISIDRDILAHDLRIAADAGRIDVLGRIDASGVEAGRVGLYAQGDVTLAGTARIDAHATGTDEQGGGVTLASTAGRLDLKAGASIHIAGTDEIGAPADSGRVQLRAPRVDANNDGVEDGVAIGDLDGTITGAGRIDIEAYKTYTAGSIDAGLIADIQGKTGTFMASAEAIENSLGIGSDARFHLLPGVEIRSPGDLALNTDWDLLGWRYDGEPGVLTLRAAGNLNINKSLSDGVAMESALEGVLEPRQTVQTGPSWSYRLAGGADLTGADPLAVARNAGDVVIGPDAEVITGTGDIEVAAGRDLRLVDSTAKITTVGENRGVGAVPGVSDFGAGVVKELVYGADFLQNGGDVRIAVAGDVHGAGSGQFINEWLARAGGKSNPLPFGEVDLPVSWAVDVAEFRQNIGALGGGDVTVTAEGGIENLSIAIPTTGQPTGAFGTAPSIAGGGDLRVETGGDLRGGVFYLARGQADIRAGGSIGIAEDESVYPVLALADGQYNLQARKHLGIETIVNPTALPQNPLQGTPEFPFSVSPTYFFTYADHSAARLRAIAGDVVINGNATALRGAFPLISGSSSTDLFNYPASLSARSLQGDIVIGGDGFTLLPAPRGDLELLAMQDVTSSSDSTIVAMSDADPGLLPGVLTPVAGLTAEVVSTLAAGHAATPLHDGDDQPARIVAETGTVGSPPDSTDKLTFVLPKQTRISAGEYVRDLTLKIQHVDAGDISVVEAGDSILFPTERQPTSGVVQSNTRQFEIAGPGQFYVIAGKDVDLGGSQGIVSAGDRNNPALDDDGADITVMAGQAPAPKYNDFIELYLAKQNSYHERLAQYMNGLASRETDETRANAFREQPLESFRTLLSLTQQRKFILEVLFNELRESGVAAVESKNYERGFTAIETLFPAGNYTGDVKSFLSRIYTLDGGTINLVVPGGLVNAGVASATGIDKQPGDLGIVVQRAGDINAFAHGDFLVNQSRVFALDGGDIVIWSSTGDIDAGKGAKTALSVPPAETRTDPNTGITTVEFPPAISGSGIRGAVSTPGREPGNTYLIAPAGVINAGDAGIGSAGNLTLAATAVIGADNIQVGGISTGIPTDTGGGAGLAGVGDIAANAGRLSEDVARGLAEQKEVEEGFLGVEVVGFGADEQGDEVLNLRKRKKSK